MLPRHRGDRERPGRNTGLGQRWLNCPDSRPARVASARSATPRGSRPRRSFTCPLSPGARPTGCSKFRGEHLLPPPRVSVLPREAPVSSAFLRSQAKILKTECAERPRWEGLRDRLPAGEPLTALTGRTRMRSRGGGGVLNAVRLSKWMLLGLRCGSVPRKPQRAENILSCTCLSCTEPCWTAGSARPTRACSAHSNPPAAGEAFARGACFIAKY